MNEKNIHVDKLNSHEILSGFFWGIPSTDPLLTLSLPLQSILEVVHELGLEGSQYFSHPWHKHNGKFATQLLDLINNSLTPSMVRMISILSNIGPPCFEHNCSGWVGFSLDLTFINLGIWCLRVVSSACR